ncbi:hypothetical protein SLS62_001161 [Diatrype stigma]|uniref:Uncharacterized protein n=1 Tax=Diatrype stigma TaxID=117547 RepID=A0AAN9UWF1_9PEZI
MYTQSLRTSEHQRAAEMRQRPRHESFFGMKGREPRPDSVATEIVDTEWDEEDISDIEDDEPNSPRVSLNSSDQPSITTLSSYDEVQTPRSSRAREAYPFDLDPLKPVVGPRGPHLFRSSTTSSFSNEYQEILSLSPITPKAAPPIPSSDHGFLYPITHDPLPRSRTSPFQFTHEKLDPSALSLWSPEKVAQWMLNAGIELSAAEKFVENDINGAILITLKFEDLRELSIQSFGVRTKIWDQIHTLRESRPASPRPDTPIDDEESKEVRRERRRIEKAERAEKERVGGQGQGRSHSVKRSRSQKPSQSHGNSSNRASPSHEDIISPLESVSIVGIEQMMPKPHHCSKGENCSKYKRQQRMIEAFKQDHPFVDMDKGGIIMVAGDPGNPQTAHALNRPSSTEALRPVSDAVPSVVASSDVLGGGGVPPLQYLQEAVLRNVQSRDPQDNVRQFLDFQHQHGEDDTSEVPPTPPFELYPSTSQQQQHHHQQQQPPHEGLRALPKLAIPGQSPSSSSGGHRLSQQLQQQRRPSAPSTTPQPQQQQQQQFFPYMMERADPRSPDLQTPTAAPYRFGTPFSDMDVPVTAVPLGPVARDASQSVPPDMSYRPGVALAAAAANPVPRSVSRASRRPSFQVQVMAPLEENVIVSPTGRTTPKPRDFISTGSPTKAAAAASSRPQQHQPLQAPPRPQYPWSSTSLATKAGVGGAGASVGNAAAAPAAAAAATETQYGADGIAYQGPVRKRKTRMLRHEWHEQYATLRGTRLALHDRAAAAAARSNSRALEYIDVDDYAIACSSVSGGSKLNAAFKAMHISRHKHSNSGGDDSVAAFSFQLIPQQPVGGGVGRLRKRESSGAAGVGVGTGPLTGGLNGSFENAVNGTGKTHHFAVRSRDERIDWMRELMLAKALKQKGEGFEVSVNGNMI